jgi:hypothetical protein
MSEDEANFPFFPEQKKSPQAINLRALFGGA